MRALAYYLMCSVCTLGACVEDVKIAAECPPNRPGPCLVEFDGGIIVPAPPSARLDGGAVISPRTDSALPGEPADDAGSYIFGELRNPSFEFTRDSGVAGDVVALSVLTTNISPWYTCQPIGGATGNSVTAVRAETGLAAGPELGAPKVDAGPTDGRTFVTIGYLVNLVLLPLVQQLTQPLQEGQRYAFVVDAFTTSPEALLSVEVRANKQGCLGAGSQTTLFKSAPITALDWTPVCVSFTSPSELNYLGIAATANADSVLDTSSLLQGDILGGPRLFFDHIRPATPELCPEL